MQGVGEVHAVFQGVQRREYWIPVVDRDVLYPDQGTQHLQDLARTQAVESAHDPFEFQQYGHRDESAGCHGDRSSGPLLCRLGVIVIIDEEARQDIGIDGLHVSSCGCLAISEAASKSSSRRGLPREGAFTIPASAVTSVAGTPRKTRNFRPSGSSMTSILDPAPIDEQAVRAIHALWIEAVNAGDVERLLSLMSSDALFLSPGRPPLGAQAFPAQFASAHEEFRIRCVSELAELVVAGDLAYTLCHDALWLTPRTGGATTELAGQRITLYRRQRDGRWLLARDAHTLLPPTR